MASEPTPTVLSGNLTVYGGNFAASNAPITQQIFTNDVGPRETEAFKTLASNVAPGALHDSGEITDDPPKCYPGTRIDVLDVLITWALATVYMFPIRWLDGPAGAGKSAIMRSFAQMLAEKGLLLASFFFFRSDGNRNTAAWLISTITYQLWRNIPPLQPYIEQAITSHPHIFTALLSTQIQTLIINPFLHYFYNPNSINITPFPRIILIDGLDECKGHEKQREILETLCRMVQTLPIPLAIVVASRPEHQIRIAFELGTLSKASTRITLDDSFNPDEDIRAFYVAEFAEIQNTHPMQAQLDLDWPTAAVITKLVLNASGQFIYAATVIKFIKSIRHFPATRLKIVLGLADRGTSKPFQKLDFLYLVIFQNVEPDVLPDTLRVLGIILTSPPSDVGLQYQSPDFLNRLLGFSPGHLQSTLLDLESLLKVTESSKNIRIFHTSLSDFLFDSSRAADFFIDRGLVYAEIAYICIKSFDVYQNFCLDVPVLDLEACIAQYTRQQIWISLKNATPTDQLQKSVVSFDITISVRGPLHQVYGKWMPAFLVGLRQSHFADAEKLYQAKLIPFKNIVNPILTNYWLQQHKFESALLLVLLLALTDTTASTAVMSFLIDVSLICHGDLIYLFPESQHSLPSKQVKKVSYDHTLAMTLLDAISSPDGLLHQPEGKAACVNLTIHLLQQIFRGKYIIGRKLEFIYAKKDYMECVLPFLLDVSLVQRGLTQVAEQVKYDRSGDGAYLQSEIIAGAIDQYLQRAVEDEEKNTTKIKFSGISKRMLSAWKRYISFD